MCEGISCRVLSNRITPKEKNGDVLTSGYILGFGNCVRGRPVQGGILWLVGKSCPCCNRLLRHWPRKGERKNVIKKAQKTVTNNYREKMATRMEILICARNVEGITYKQFRDIYRTELRHKLSGKVRQIQQTDKRLEGLFKDFVLPSGL